MIETIITIICLGGFIAFNIYYIKENWDWSIGECIFTLVFSGFFAFIGWLVLNFIYFIFEKPIGDEVIKKQDIYSIKDNSSISGSWALFGGSIDEVDYYYYWIKTDKGKYRERIEAENCYIIEEDIEQPYYEELEPICKQIDGVETACLYKDNTYVFHIPKGSIKYDYSLE